MNIPQPICKAMAFDNRLSILQAASRLIKTTASASYVLNDVVIHSPTYLKVM